MSHFLGWLGEESTKIGTWLCKNVSPSGTFPNATINISLDNGSASPTIENTEYLGTGEGYIGYMNIGLSGRSDYYWNESRNLKYELLYDNSGSYVGIDYLNGFRMLNIGLKSNSTGDYLKYAASSGGENGWYDRASLDFFVAGLSPPLLQDALSPASKLAKGLEWAGPIGFGVGAMVDGLAWRNNLIHGEGSPNSITGSKFLINTAIGFIGWKLCPELGIIYSGVDNLYPGGVAGYERDTYQSLNRVDNSGLSTSLHIQGILGINNMFGSGDL